MIPCGSLNEGYKRPGGVKIDAWGSDLTTGSNPHLPFPSSAKEKVGSYPSTLLNSGLYRDNLCSTLESSIRKVMLWTHILYLYVYTVIGSDVKKCERQTKLKSCDQISPMVKKESVEFPEIKIPRPYNLPSRFKAS